MIPESGPQPCRRDRREREADREAVDRFIRHAESGFFGDRPPGPWARPLAGGGLYVCFAGVTRIWAKRSECSFSAKRRRKRTPSAPRLVHEEQQHNQAQAIYGRLHAHNHNNHHHRLETDLTRNAHGRHRAPTNQTFFPPNPPGVYGHGQMAMECLQQGGEGRCRPGPHGPWPAAARNSLARACSEGCCMVSGRLCQAAEGRGTQYLARPPGSSGSSAVQGLGGWN